MIHLQNTVECHKIIKPPTPRCRQSIREALQYSNINNNNNNNSTKNNMSYISESSTVRRKVCSNSKEYKNTANSDSDNDSTDNESSIDNTSDRDCSSKHMSSSKDHTHEESIKIKERSQTSSFCQCVPIRTLIRYILVLFLCYLCFLLIWIYVSQNINNQLKQEDEKRKETIQEFRESIKTIRLKYKSQNFNIWNAFASQIEEIINESAKTSVIVLLGNETNTVTCFAHLFGHISSKALSNNKYLTLNARNIGNDHGEIINKLKAEIQIDRVVIIEDLLTINSEAIKVLHNLCDKEHPLVLKTVYIITIISNNYEGTHAERFVEDYLTITFSKGISLDILNPLITRIMDGPIISVLPEPSMKGSKTVKDCLLF